MYKDIIGIVGGMGSYSTLYFYKEILDSLATVEDNERPRIIIDNYCNIPNKISACLSKEEVEPFLSCLSTSITNLINSGCTKIVIVCNITHVLLDELYTIHPIFEKYIVSMLEVLFHKLKYDGITKAILFATQNAIKSQVFQMYLPEIELVYPDCDSEQKEIFSLMKLGKSNDVTEDMCKRFVRLCNTYKGMPIIIGCTELSMIFANVKRPLHNHIYDPMHETIRHLLTVIK